MVEVKNLTKTFGGFTALKELNMTIPKGAVYGLVGPNGAGKSTLIRHIAGIYRPDSGEITIDGEAVWENPNAKAKLGYIIADCIPVSTTSSSRSWEKNSTCPGSRPSANSPRA